MKVNKNLSVCLVLIITVLGAYSQIGTNGTGWVNGYYIGPGEDLSYANLAGADLAEADLTGARLSYANLAGADLTDATMQSTIFNDTDCTAAVFADANLNWANGTRAVLTDATFTNANLTSCDLNKCNLHRANLTAADLNGADFHDADLAYAVLTSAIMHSGYLWRVSSGNIVGTPGSLPAGWLLYNGYLVGPTANLSDAGLAGINVADADLHNVTFNGTDLSGADLTGTDLSRADFANANLNATSLTNADLSVVSSGGIVGNPASLPRYWRLANGYLVGPTAALAYADLSGADLGGTFLGDTDLSYADLSGANLHNVYFENANLMFADFSNADLTGALFYGANLYKATFSGAAVTGTILDFQSKSELEMIAAYEAELATNYTLAEIRDLRSGSTMIEISNGIAMISFNIDESTNLVDWTELTNTTWVTIPVDDADAKFFRFKMSDEGEQKILQSGCAVETVGCTPFSVSKPTPWET